MHPKGGVFMKHVILEALERLKNYEKLIARKVPRPTYLFVQKYGRTLEGVMKKIAQAFGKEKFLIIRKGSESKECSLTDRVSMEARKEAELGKSFDGVVLVELTGEEPVKERVALYEYLKENASSITCMFTTKTVETGVALEKEMEQHFSFVRMISEECYSVTEQKEILITALKQGGAVLTRDAEECIGSILAEIEWKESDHVENKIRNFANNLVYEQIMNGTESELITRETLVAGIKKLKGETAGKIKIGFAPPNSEHENHGKEPDENRKELVA